MHQHAGRALGPAPGGQIIEEQPQVLHGAMVVTHRDGLAVANPTV
ncbi:MAG: hypothetical protein ACRDRY_23260 [Pseudonocardiaceae bacterium]